VYISISYLTENTDCSHCDDKWVNFFVGKRLFVIVRIVLQNTQMYNVASMENVPLHERLVLEVDFCTMSSTRNIKIVWRLTSV